MNPPAHLLQTPMVAIHTVLIPCTVFGHIGNYFRTRESYNLGEESVAAARPLFEEWVQLVFDCGVVVIVDVEVDAHVYVRLYVYITRIVVIADVDETK